MSGYIIFALKLMLLFCSLLGYVFIIREKLKINTAFIFSTAISLIVTIVYIGGIAGFLSQTSLTVTILGIIFFIVYIAKTINKSFDMKFLYSPAVVFFIIMSFYFVILLKGVNYLHYDNFSHWGTIVKEIFFFDSLPDSRTIINDFRNYPPGTAVFIYYICKIIGYSESHALMSHGILISSFLAPLFCETRFKNTAVIISIILTSLTALCVLSYDDTTLNIYNLLVDGILAFETSACIICSYYYKDAIKKQFFILSPMLSMLVLTKDSGLLFFSMIIIYILYQQFKNLKLKNLFYYICICLIPTFIYLIWKLYVNYAYLSYNKTEKFHISPSLLLNDLDISNNQKSDFIKSLPIKILSEMFNINSINTKLFILINLLSIISIIFLYIKKKNTKLIKTGFILTNLMTTIYMISLYVLYSSIMSPDEAVSLSAFDRYYSTMVIIQVIIQLFMIITNFSKIYPSTKANLSISCILSLIILFAQRSNAVQLFIKPNEKNFRRHYIQSACKKARNYIGRDQKILLYNGDKGDDGYYYFLLKYEMLTDNCSVVSKNSFDITTLNNFDYIIISEGKEDFFKLISTFENTSIDSKDGNIYKIHKYNNKLKLARLDKHQISKIT